MIFDRLENLPLYLPLHPQLAHALAFLQERDLQALPSGRYPVDDRGAFVLVSTYTTRTEADCFIECHRQFIDIQLLAEGAEGVGICNRRDCRELPFDQEKDFGKLQGATDLISLRPGYFVIFFPDDGHMPGMQLQGHPAAVKKLVFKLPVESTD